MPAQQTADGWRVAVPEPLPEAPEPPPDAVPEAAGTVPEPPWRELVDVLEATVADLRARLDAREQAEAELRRLLAAALQQRALPAPSKPNSEIISELPDLVTRRPWWVRWVWWRW